MPKIKLKGGLEANLPILDEREPAFTTDTEKLFIGSKDGNIQFAKQSDLSNTIANVATNTANIASNTATLNSIGTINANAELVAARGTYPTLAPRLDNVDTTLASNATNITNQKYFVSTKEFPRIAPETDDTPRILRAMQSLSQGGKVVCELIEYQIKSTITVPQNIQLLGLGFGKWTTGTSFRCLTANIPVFNFGTNTNGIVLSNFKIYANSGDPSYQNFTGIDVTAAEMVSIENIMIQKANIGIDCSGSVNYIYLLNINNIFVYNCLNEGILIRSTGQWKNGIKIKVGDISYNNIGIHAQSGLGNAIIGDGSEVGNNTTGGILIEGGVWTVRGNLWIENSPYGIKTTGGHTNIENEVYCSVPILNNGGSLVGGSNQAIVNYIPTTKLKNGLIYWYSFEEGSGSYAYDRTNSYKGTFTAAPTWNTDLSVYGSTAQVASGDISIPTGNINWLGDWTVLLLTKGPNTGYCFLVKGSDATKNLTLRPYTSGVQLSLNSVFMKNFLTYPNGDGTTNLTWKIVSYNSTTKIMTAYSKSGRVQDTFDLTSNPIDSTLGSPSLVSLGGASTVVDEAIVFNRIITDSEIRAITGMTLPPDVRNTNHKVITSPDGSVWKQTIDNTGVTTWTKL